MLSNKANPNYFYTYTKNRSKCTSKIGPLLNEKDQLTKDSKKWLSYYLNSTPSVFSKPKAASENDKTTIADSRFKIQYLFTKGWTECNKNTISCNTLEN